ncbi:MAG TPA: phage tail sheath subtilisin-like domain-containing protein [Edaphobacter sp.]|nr:phage tail sheath subtilisin-like domain-containing protein [Edaphobacter sp.]
MPPETPKPASPVQKAAPGTFIQELPGQPVAITAADHSAAAFVGPTLKGPADGTPVPVTSLAEFVAVNGDLWDLTAAGRPARNYVALAAKGFFDNGGQRLYISRPQNSGSNDPASLTAEDYAQALARLEDIPDISVVAAPGAHLWNAQGKDSVLPIHAALIAHVSRPQAYRFALLDPPQGSSLADLQALRAQLDSSYAALYCPWLVISNPLPDATTRPEILLPPSGFVAGIYMRTDLKQGPWKAPSNEAVMGAVGVEMALHATDTDTLNQAGIDTIQSFPGRGTVVWGARTVSSDPEWRYISVRRYVLYLERSIDLGTQWAVFEPDSESLWQAVQSSISSFLMNEWRKGALTGSKPEEAFFVRCDRTTMTQSDLDDGRLVCMIGVALLRPAEFVIFRISHLTQGTLS